ncbi:hypothetical protein V1478_009625 [Vespula squamosa]|uniref:Uncharacterized protein n=1 Tax=Vespula squamosa TaxID=30214 RepID=A0ABD2AQ67_VESSQ
MKRQQEKGLRLKRDEKRTRKRTEKGTTGAVAVVAAAATNDNDNDDDDDDESNDVDDDDAIDIKNNRCSMTIAGRRKKKIAKILPSNNHDYEGGNNNTW